MLVNALSFISKSCRLDKQLLLGFLVAAHGHRESQKLDNLVNGLLGQQSSLKGSTRAASFVMLNETKKLLLRLVWLSLMILLRAVLDIALMKGNDPVCQKLDLPQK